MTQHLVSVRNVPSYDAGLIEKAVAECLKENGGLSAYVMPGEHVILKVNLLMGKDPQAAVTTHPEFVRAIINLLKKNHNQITIADSPGGLFTSSALEKAYKRAGFYDLAKDTGVELNWDTGCSQITGLKGKTSNKLPVCDYYLKADKVINLPKLKTHAMMTYTGGVKNLYGIIPGTDKADLHFRMSKKEVFADLLIDIYQNFPPALTIMDGIVGMEGDGPSSGSARAIGAVLLSADAHKLDYVASLITGISYQEIPTLKQAEARGILSKKDLYSSEESRQWVSALLINDFVLPARNIQIDFSRESTPAFVKKMISYFFESKPVILDSCIACGVCRDHCPAKVIEIEKKAVIYYENCIKCYCCHELCPVSAIDISESFLVKWLKNR